MSSDPRRLTGYLGHIVETIERIGRYTEGTSESGFRDSPLVQDNAVVHGYFKVDLEIVWKAIRRDLPKLHAQVQEVRTALDCARERQGE